MLGRAERLLPAEHGQITVRGDNGFYSVELMMGCRGAGCASRSRRPAPRRCGQGLPRSPRTPGRTRSRCATPRSPRSPFTPEGWKHEPLRLIVRRVPVTAHELLAGSPKARRRKTIPPEQLQMVLDGQLDSTYAYSFIVTDIPATEKSTAEVEHFHRQRAQIEERFKDAKLGQALRHLPSGKLAANRLWLCCALLAFNLSAWVCDISPAAGASGNAPDAHAAAPARQDAAADAVLRARPDRAHRPPHDRAAPRRIPALRALQRHLPRRARAPRPIAPARRLRTPAPAAPPSSPTPRHRRRTRSAHHSAATDSHPRAAAQSQPATTTKTRLTVTRPPDTPAHRYSPN